MTGIPQRLPHLMGQNGGNNHVTFGNGGNNHATYASYTGSGNNHPTYTQLRPPNPRGTYSSTLRYISNTLIVFKNLFIK